MTFTESDGGETKKVRFKKIGDEEKKGQGRGVKLRKRGREADGRVERKCEGREREREVGKEREKHYRLPCQQSM